MRGKALAGGHLQWGNLPTMTRLDPCNNPPLSPL